LFSFLAIIVFVTYCKKGSNDDILSLRKIKFNDGWSYQLGDNKLAIQANFNDSAWEKVKIPHDWSIE